MQDFKLAKKFDFIFIGFNSFLHNLTDKDALNCLRCVREHLASDGIFLLSIFLPDPEFLYRDEYLYEARTFFNYKGKQCRVLEKNSYDDETQINKYFFEREFDVHTFGPEYAYPEVFDEHCNFEPKIVHLAKDNSKYQQ